MSGELPKGWAWATLGDIADCQLGKMLDKKKQVKGEFLPYLRNINVRWGYFNLDDLFEMPFNENEKIKFSIKNGDILICEGGEPGRSAVWHGGNINIKFQKAIHRARVKNGINPRWIAFRLQYDAAVGSLTNYLTGTTIKHFPGEALARYHIPLAPKQEQTRIVEKIDVLYERSRAMREELAHIPKLIERYRQAVLEAAFRGDLTADWRDKHSLDANIKLRHTITTKIKESNNINVQDGLPKGWTVASLNQIADIETGATPKRNVSKYYQDGDIPWVTSGAVNKPIIDQSDQYITNTAIEETNCKIFPPGSLIMAMYGEGKTRGKVSELSIHAATNQACAAIIIHNTEYHNKDYVRYFLEMTYISIRSRAAGGVQPNLNLSIIGDIEVPFATSGEQRLIVERVKSALTVVDLVKAQCERADLLTQRLDQAILDKAFRGELVPQDPNDEPASVLLERIKAARAAAPAPRRGRRAKSAE